MHAFPEAHDVGNHRYLHVWRLKDPLNWTNGPTIAWCKRLDVGPYTWSGSTGMNIAQPHGSLQFLPGDCRLMDKVTYRRIPYLPGYLYAAHHVRYGWGLDNRMALRIYRLQVDPNNADDPNCIQVDKDCVYGAAGFDYFFPSVQPSGYGDMAIVHCRSSDVNGQYAQVRIAGWKHGDAQINEGSYLAHKGTVVEGLWGNHQRWGDYFGSAPDPLDTGRVWVIGQFAWIDPNDAGCPFDPNDPNAPRNWGTWVTECGYVYADPWPDPNTAEGNRGESIDLSATFKDRDSNRGIPDLNIRFFVADQPAGVACTNSDGRVSVRFRIPDTLSRGEHELRVLNDPDGKYARASGKAILRVR